MGGWGTWGWALAERPHPGPWAPTCGAETADGQQQGSDQGQRSAVHAVHPGVCARGLIQCPGAGLQVGAGAGVGSRGDPRGAGGRSNDVPAPAFWGGGQGAGEVDKGIKTGPGPLAGRWRGGGAGLAGTAAGLAWGRDTDGSWGLTLGGASCSSSSPAQGGRKCASLEKGPGQAACQAGRGSATGFVAGWGAWDGGGGVGEGSSPHAPQMHSGGGASHKWKLSPHSPQRRALRGQALAEASRGSSEPARELRVPILQMKNQKPEGRGESWESVVGCGAHRSLQSQSARYTGRLSPCLGPEMGKERFYTVTARQWGWGPGPRDNRGPARATQLVSDHPLPLGKRQAQVKETQTLGTLGTCGGRWPRTQTCSELGVLGGALDARPPGGKVGHGGAAFSRPW